MDKRPRSTVTALDDLDEVIGVIYLMGRIVGAIELNERDRLSAQLVCNWSAERMSKCYATFAGRDQAGSAPS